MSVYGNTGKNMTDFGVLREKEIGCPPRNSEEKDIFSELIGRSSDSDSLLIIIILYLLLRDGGDKKLILALAYILM